MQFDSFMIKPITPYASMTVVYFKQCNDDFTYLLLYVDDMLIATRNKIYIQKFKAQLKKEFDMKDSGEAKKILDMETCGQTSNYPRRIMLSRCWKDSI